MIGEFQVPDFSYFSCCPDRLATRLEIAAGVRLRYADTSCRVAAPVLIASLAIALRTLVSARSRDGDCTFASET